MSKRELNPELVKGDRVMCLHMDGETGVPMGGEGVVTKVGRDPFEEDGKIIEVKWDNGSSLALISVTDSWVKVADSQIKESKVGDSRIDYFSENPEIFDHFDWRFFREYLTKIRESSVINMFGASPLLYAGREHIDRYYGENPPNQEAFDEVLDMADTAKDKIVEGTVKYLKSKNKEISVEGVQSVAPKFARKLTELYMIFPQMER